MVKDNGGMIAGIIYSGFGFLLTPDTLSDILHIPAVQSRYANIIFGWISPLNHATYYMHSFGYDNLPKLWVSYVFLQGWHFDIYIVSAPDPQVYVPVHRNTVTINILCK